MPKTPKPPSNPIGDQLALALTDAEQRGWNVVATFIDAPNSDTTQTNEGDIEMTNTPTPGTRVAIYARSATSHQAANPIEDQLARARVYAERQGLVVVEVYSDGPASGRTLAGRTGFFAMMAAAERGEFDLVLVEDLDRLSRNALDVHSLIEELKRLNIKVCTVDWGVTSDLVLVLRAAMASEAKRAHSDKIRRGLARRRELIASGMIAPRKKLYSPSVVECIVEDYNAGVSITDICRALNAGGVPAPRQGGVQ